MPTFATEQYPKGLGPTVPEIELAKFNIVPHAKTCFTMCLPELVEQMKAAQPETKSVILCGIETQACITHTTLGIAHSTPPTPYLTFSTLHVRSAGDGAGCPHTC